MSGVAFVYASAERRAAMREKALRAEALTVRCADCDWSYEGRADVALRRHRDHRTRRHGRPESSDLRWHDEPPRGRQAPAPVAEAEPRREPSFRERAVELLRERGESTSSELGAELGATAASVSSALGWAVREGRVQSRSTPGAKEKLWRIAGTEPGPDPEARPTALTIEDALAAAGRPMSIDEVAAATGRPRDSVSTTLAGLVRRGRAERLGRGVYRLAG